MHRPNHSTIALMTVTCVLLLIGTLIFSITAPNAQAAAFLQGPSNTPYYTPAFGGTLIPADHQQSNAGFGSAVSTSNGIILVGAPYSFSNQGAAYIYNQPNFTTWDQTAELIAPDGDPGDLFGSAVSIGIGTPGKVAIIGAPGDDSAGVDAGAVYVYVHDQDWMFTARINAPDAATGDQFGYSVGYSNGNIIVGAPFADAGGYSDIGAAYVFTGSGTDWYLEQKLDYSLMYPLGQPQRSNGQRFGYAVDIYGNQAVVTSVLASDVDNRVHIFNRVDTSWSFQQIIQPQSDNIGYGRAAAIYHDTVVVGASLYDDPVFGVDAGRIFVYKWASGSYILQPQGDYTHFGAGHQGGSSVDVYRGNTIAGAPYATVEPGGAAKGSVLVFDPNARLIRETALSDGSQFGASVAFWGGDLVVGAPGEDYNGLINPGVVYVYRVVMSPWATATATSTNYFPTATFQVPSLTPSSTATDGPMPTATPSRTPTSTPPTAIASPNSTIAPNFFAIRRPTLTWDNITWAQGYQIEIDDDPAFNSPITAELPADTLSFTVAYPLTNDTYYWHVRAKKNDIDWSNWSTPQTFIVSAP